MKIKYSLLLFCFFRSITACAQQPLPDTVIADKADKKITGNIEMNYLRHYIWRGIIFGSNDVAQPEFNLEWKNFSLGLAANLNYNPAGLPKELYRKNVVFDEQDIELGYSTSYKNVDIEMKAMAYFYLYQIGSPSTAELYNKISLNITDKFSLFTENVVDIASYRGAYYNNTGVCYSTDFEQNFSLECTVYGSYGNKKFNAAYAGSEAAAFNLIGGAVEATKNFGPFYLCLFAEINNYTNAAIKQSTELQKTDNYSIALGWNF